MYWWQRKLVENLRRHDAIEESLLQLHLPGTEQSGFDLSSPVGDILKSDECSTFQTMLPPQMWHNGGSLELVYQMDLQYQVIFPYLANH